MDGTQCLISMPALDYVWQLIFFTLDFADYWLPDYHGSPSQHETDTWRDEKNFEGHERDAWTGQN